MQALDSPNVADDEQLTDEQARALLHWARTYDLHVALADVDARTRRILAAARDGAALSEDDRAFVARLRSVGAGATVHGEDRREEKQHRMVQVLRRLLKQRPVTGEELRDFLGDLDRRFADLPDELDLRAVLTNVRAGPLHVGAYLMARTSWRAPGRSPITAPRARRIVPSATGCAGRRTS